MNTIQATSPVGVNKLSDTTALGLYQRASAAFQEANKWQGVWMRLMTFVAPQLNNYYNASGTGKRPNCYDNSAMHYTNSYVAQFIANVFPPESKWASFRPSYAMIREFADQTGDNINDQESWNHIYDYLQRGCEKLTDRVFDVISDSNFDEVIPTVVRNFAISCGAMHVGRDTYRGHGVSFYVPPLGSFGFDADSLGNIYGIFYQSKMLLSNARLQWKLSNIPDNIKENQEVTITECTVKNGDKWTYYVLMGVGNGRKGAPVAIVAKPRDMDFCPWSLLKDRATTGELWPRGILMNCLPDIEATNNDAYLDRLNRETATFTSFMYKDDGSIDPKTFNLKPGSLIKVASTGGANGASLVPITMPYNLAAHQATRDENRSDLMRNLLGDPMLSKDYNSYQSAREWSDRQRLNQIRHGGYYGAIQQFARSTLLSVTEQMLGIEGLIDIPEELSGFRSIRKLGDLGVRLESPISYMYNTQEVESLIGIVQVVGSISPELMQTTMNLREIPRWLGRKSGVTSDLFLSDDEQAQQADAAEALMMASNPANSVTPMQGGTL